ncbi:MAG: transposase, partial [Acidobacteria bacterium]
MLDKIEENSYNCYRSQLWMEKEIKRSLIFSLEFANTGKKRFLDELWEEYKKALQYFIDLGWGRKKLPSYEDAKIYPYETWLSKRYLGNALLQAQAILKAGFRKLKKKKETKKPEIKNISLKLDSRVFRLERGQNTYDYWFELRDSRNERWIAFPVKSYEYANSYFDDYQLCSDIELLKKDGRWFLKLIFKKKVNLESKEPKGIDIGYRKLITTSDEEIFGEEVKGIIEKRIEPKKQGSKNWKRAKHFLKTEINRILKQVIDGSFSPVLERLKNLKKGKSSKWRKDVNRKFNYWIYGYVLKRIKELCELAGVQHYIVSANYTSRTCPECGFQDKENRKGEH